jgi:hypothetical protein
MMMCIDMKIVTALCALRQGLLLSNIHVSSEGLADVSRCNGNQKDKLVCKIASTVSVPKGVEIRRQLPLILNVDSRSERC